MSSFICNSHQFNSIERAIQDLANGKDFYFPHILQELYPELQKHGTSRDKADAQITEIIDTWREINVKCVCLQYAHHYADADQEIKEELEILMNDKHKFKVLTLVELYKQLRCLQYQIEIEHLEETRELTEKEKNAMIFLNEIDHAIASKIVRDLPAYDRAAW